jgi:L-fuconolactonase
MFIIDSQVHLFLPDSSERPWREQYRGLAHGVSEYRPTTLLPLMDGAGVQRAVIVPPIWAGDDNTPCLEWSAEYPDRFKIMGRFDVHDPNRERIETWLDQSGMLGIRLAGGLDQGEWLDLEQFGWFWAAAERLHIPVMLFASEQRIRLVNAIAERHPDLRLIIDHFGVTVGNLAGVEPWKYIDEVLALAAYPNVWAKLSALPLNTLEPYPFASQTPYIKRAYDTFGPRRLAWGTDGSRFQRFTYKEAVDHMLFTIDFLSDEDKKWIMGWSIAAAINWPVPEST